MTASDFRSERIWSPPRWARLDSTPVRGVAAALLLNLFVVSCSTVGGDAAAQADPVRIQFLDSETFDTELSSALEERGPEVEVTMVGPVTLNEVPERLDVWLYHVKDNYGGELELIAEDGEFAARGPGAMGLGLAIVAYGRLREHLLYRPARNYDALVYYTPADGRITRVIFRHKPEGTADR